MKTLKKSLALLLAVIMLLSSFAFVIANADDNEGRTVVNIQITPPQAGNKAEETFKVDDERFTPGFADYVSFSESPVDCIARYGKMLSPEEYVDKMTDGFASQQQDAFLKAYYEALKPMMKNGITWIEYDLNDFQKMIDAGKTTREELEAMLKEYSKLELAGWLLQSSSEYGGKIGDSEYSTTARFMKPGDTFKEGKSYMCWCEAFVDIKAETAEYIKACNAIKPYFEKYAEINKKRADASEEEDAELKSQLEALDTQYKDGIDAVKAAVTAVQNKVKAAGCSEFPILTVNGEKTEDNRKSLWMACYDFGEAKKAPTILEKIIEFFNSIIELLKNLFGFIPAVKQ